MKIHLRKSSIVYLLLAALAIMFSPLESAAPNSIHQPAASEIEFQADTSFNILVVPQAAISTEQMKAIKAYCIEHYIKIEQSPDINGSGPSWKFLKKGRDASTLKALADYIFRGVPL